MKIEKGDFVEIDFVGRIKETGQIFDLTDEKVAEENHLTPHHHEGHPSHFEPLVFCVGEGEVVKGLDQAIQGKEVGQRYVVEVPPEDGFGKKDAKLMKLVPTNLFRKQNIAPMPGLQVNIDTMMGTIRTVTGGRTLVDFNHPLAGRLLVYEVTIRRKLTTEEEKVKAFLKLHMRIKPDEIDIKDHQIVVKQEVPATVQKEVMEKMKNVIPSIMSIEFGKKPAKPKEKKKAHDAKP